jgi:hypothetical protein
LSDFSHLRTRARFASFACRCVRLRVYLFCARYLCMCVWYVGSEHFSNHNLFWDTALY